MQFLNGAKNFNKTGANIDFITGIYIIQGKEGIFVTHVLELGLECVIVFIWKG